MNKLSPELQAKRDEQLKEYRAEQLRMADSIRPAQTPIHKVPASVSLHSLTNLLPEIISLNIASLNSSSNTRTIINNELDYRINEFYNLMKTISTYSEEPVERTKFPVVEAYTSIGLNKQLLDLRTKLNEYTSQNINLLNLGFGKGNTSMENGLPTELFELFYIIDNIRTNFKFSGRLIIS